MERNSGAMAFLGIVYFVGIVALCIQLARLAGNLWVGVLVFVGLLAIHIAASRVGENRFTGVFWLAWGGAWAISYAGMTAEYAGRWIWAIPWAIAGLLYLGIGAAAYGKVKWVSTAGFGLGIWAFAWTVVGPLWLYGMNQEETQEWTLDLLRAWWWIPVAFLGALLAIGLFAAVGSWLMDRRKERKRARQRQARARRRPIPTPRPVPEAVPGVQTRPCVRVEPTKPKPLSGPVVIGSTATAKEKPLLMSVEPRKKPPIPGADDDLGTIYVHPGTDFDDTVFVGADLAGEALYAIPEPVVDLLARAGDHFVLTEDGHVSRWHRGRLVEAPGVLLARPGGLGAGGNVVVAADQDKRLILIEYANGGLPQIRSHRVDYTIGSFAVNPFGTIVAYAPTQKPSVFAVLLASGQTQVLSEDVGSTNAVAFSSDGRLLALGGKDGRVRMFDMSTRKVIRVFDPPTSEHGKVLSLAECPERGWVAGYASGRVVHWEASGDTRGIVRESHRVSALAVSPRSGAVAVGCDDGHVVVHPTDLDTAIFDDVVARERVVGVAFEDGDGSLIAAGHDGSVRRAGV